MSSPLTARQEECLRLTRFKTDKEIATELGLAEATVKKHVAEACQRLGVNRRKAALALLEQADEQAAADIPAAEPAVGSGPDGRRLAYLAPPRGALPRAAIVGIMAVLLVLVVQATTRLMFEVHGQVDRIDRVVSDLPEERVAAPARRAPPEK